MEAGSRRGERQIRRAVFDYVESEERAEEEEEERALWGGERELYGCISARSIHGNQQQKRILWERTGSVVCDWWERRAWIF